MHILLPPSETKRSGGDGIFVPETLSNDSSLRDARILVRDALVDLCGDQDAAAKALKLGVKNRAESERNLDLRVSGVMPAFDRYTGVLYDALDAVSLGTDERQWLQDHVSIQSALFGLVSSGDLIPAYRLSASSRIPVLGMPLKRLWAPAHEGVFRSGRGWILDLRSQDYAALAPLPSGAGARLNVAQRGADGEVRALNHFNKAAKGDLVRQLAKSGAMLSGVEDFCDWAHGEGIEVSTTPEMGELTLLTELGAPVLSASR